MYLYNSTQIKAWDEYTINEQNIKSHDLMERAGQKLFDQLVNLIKEKDASIHIFCGTGNNGGDGLVIARHLRDHFYKVYVYECRIADRQSSDFTFMKERLQYASNIQYRVITNESELPDTIDGYLIDCIFGMGINKPLDGLALKIISKLNAYQTLAKISIDVPSGLFIDIIESSTAFKADFTLTIQNLKLPFLFESSHAFIGEVIVVDIGLSNKFSEVSDFIVVIDDLITSMLPVRKKYDHKGNFGKAVLISGDETMLGASVLACKAMLKSGVGIAHVITEDKNSILFQYSTPEIICLLNVDHPLDDIKGIAIGPGLGVNEKSIQKLKKLLNLNKPLVLDADALNILAAEKLLDQIMQNSVLTPHPKEFDRLFGGHVDNYHRMLTQQKVSMEKKIYIILKSAHTIISCPDGKIFFNTTGNPGMAKGGSGDALTGFLTGLIARTGDTKSACLLAVYLHGLAGDIAAAKYSKESFNVSQMISCMDDAWTKVFNSLPQV